MGCGESTRKTGKIEIGKEKRRKMGKENPPDQKATGIQKRSIKDIPYPDEVYLLWGKSLPYLIVH